MPSNRANDCGGQERDKDAEEGKEDGGEEGGMLVRDDGRNESSGGAEWGQHCEQAAARGGRTA